MPRDELRHILRTVVAVQSSRRRSARELRAAETTANRAARAARQHPCPHDHGLRPEQTLGVSEIFGAVDLAPAEITYLHRDGRKACGDEA